jgi:cobalt/nickel transport system permease protein
MGPKKNNFIEKSLVGAVSFFKDFIFAEEYAGKAALLQSIDPRIKTISFALLIITVLFLKTIKPILFIYFIVLSLAFISKIDLGYFLKRTWIFIPIFSLFIAIPAIFSVFSPGEALLSFKIFNATLTVTHQGLMSAGLFISRVITSVSIVVLLSLTTKHVHMLYALAVFGVPAIFIMTINMCYRYIYLFTRIIEETYLALKSRAGTAVYSGQGQRIVSWNIANLWNRSYQMHKDVYGAMVSRGYGGSVQIAENFKSRAKDWAWLAASAAMSAVLLFAQYRSG